MQISEIWRYPVKSLRGERLDTAEIAAGGIVGDRVVHVSGAGKLRTGRTRYGLLTVPAATGADGTPLVGGHPWHTAPAAELVRRHAGPDAELVRYDGPERFDVLPLLVATDGAVNRFGHDVRRLRPNLVISGVAPDAEPCWPGHALQIGAALIGVHSVRPRCVATTIDPDSGAQDLDVLRRVRAEFDGAVSLDCWVIRPGQVRLGESVRLVPTDQTPSRIGGWIVGAPYLVGDELVG